MKTNDYVKYITQQVVSYVDTPSEKRKAMKEELKANKPPFLYRWFGLLPFAVAHIFKSIKMKKK